MNDIAADRNIVGSWRHGKCPADKSRDIPRSSGIRPIDQVICRREVVALYPDNILVRRVGFLDLQIVERNAVRRDMEHIAASGSRR